MPRRIEEGSDSAITKALRSAFAWRRSTAPVRSRISIVCAGARGITTSPLSAGFAGRVGVRAFDLHEPRIIHRAHALRGVIQLAAAAASARVPPRRAPPPAASSGRECGATPSAPPSRRATCSGRRALRRCAFQGALRVLESTTRRLRSDRARDTDRPRRRRRQQRGIYTGLSRGSYQSGAITSSRADCRAPRSGSTHRGAKRLFMERSPHRLRRLPDHLGESSCRNT